MYIHIYFAYNYPDSASNFRNTKARVIVTVLSTTMKLPGVHIFVYF